MMFPKVVIRKLPIVSPPIPEGGGRVFSPAGELAQIVNGEAFRFLAVVEFKPESSGLRGNHYHIEKIEMLYLISGRLRAHYVDLDNGDRFEPELESGDLVSVMPKCAHAYVALEHTYAVEITEGVYNPTDTIPHKVYTIGGQAG